MNIIHESITNLIYKIRQYKHADISDDKALSASKKKIDLSEMKLKLEGLNRNNDLDKFYFKFSIFLETFSYIGLL